MKFKVTIDFRRGPSFSTIVNAENEDEAKARAIHWAYTNGFDGIREKVTVRPA